jgi:glycosyltransferase involved in cell wall biosynthesis
VEIHVQQVAQALSSRHHVTVCAFKFANYSLPRRLRVLDNNLLAAAREKARSDGAVRVVSLAPTTVARCKMIPLVLRATPRLQRWYRHQINGLTRPFYFWAIEPIISKAIEGADIVHCMAFGDLGVTAQRVAYRAGIPFVCTPFVHRKQWGDSPDDIKLYQRSDAVIALVPTDHAYLEKIGVSRAQLHTIGVSPSLPESIDAGAFRRDEHLVDRQPIILYLGRLMAQKGAQSLVAAAPLVWKRVPKANFVFIGPGTNEETAIFRGADADRRLRFLGRVSDQRKAEALAACTLLCVPSVSEILPTVYLEAWSLGKPVIAGTAPGIPQLVEDNQAGLCVPQQPETIAEAIIGLLQNPKQAQAYAKSGKKLVEKLYSNEAVASALEKVYWGLTSAKNKSSL